MMKKILIGFNIFMFGVFIYFIFLLVYPFKTVVFKSAQFPVVTKTVKAGDTFIYISNVCKYTRAPATVTREFVNDIVYTQPSIKSNRSYGCNDDHILVIVPKELPKGKYRMRVRIDYDINFLRTITMVHYTDWFEVK